MIAIRNSKFFVLIALLLSITTLVYAGFWYIIGLIAAVFTIVVGFIQLVKWAVELVKSKKQKLADMEADLADAEKERDDNVEKYNEYKRLIERYDTLRGQAQSELDTADLVYEAAKQAYDAAKTEVSEKSKAYDQAKTAYDDHIYDCSYCEGSNLCTTGTQLSNQMSNSHEDLRQAKVSRTFARSTYNSAKKDKDKWQSKLDEYTKKRDDYQDDKDDLVESNAAVLEKIETLSTKEIPTQKQRIEESETYLEKVSNKETEAKGYHDSINAAYEAGEDMEPQVEGIEQWIKDMVQWMEDNPPPAD